MKNQKLRICLSGFHQKERGILKGEIEQLQMIYEESLTFETDILVSHLVTTEKYKMASKLGIPILKEQWIHESFSNEKKLLNQENYQLPFLTDVNIGILGFSEKMTQNIKDIINKQHIIQNIKSLDLILVRKESLVQGSNTLKFVRETRLTTVSTEWLGNCLEHKIYITPLEYHLLEQAVVRGIKKQIEIRDNLGLLKHRITSKIDSVSCADENWQFLSSCFIYFGNYQEQNKETLSKIVDMGGGFVVDDVYPVTTHVISEENNQTLRSKCVTYRKVYIVSSQWLIDSFLYQRKPKEAHYLTKTQNVRKPKNNFAGLQQLQLRRSQSVNSHQLVLGQKLLLSGFEKKDKKNKMLHSLKSKKNSMKQTKLGGNSRKAFTDKTNQQIEVKSKLFQNIFFSFCNPKDRSLRKKLQKYMLRVKEHSGKIEYHDRKKEKRKSLAEKFGCMKWKIKIACDEERFFEQGRKFLENPKNKRKNMLVSYRWIDYCIEKKQIYLDFKNQIFLALIPFPHKVPIKNFDKINFCISGFSKDEKYFLKKLGIELGAKYTNQMDKLDMLIAGSVGQKCKEVLAYNKEAKNPIHIVKPEWLTTCCQTGNFIKLKNYLLSSNKDKGKNIEDKVKAK